MALDALLTHCRLADGRLVEIGIAGGRIATIGEDAAPSLSNRVPILDIGGDLVLPCLVDGHMHLDKTLMGLPWMPHMAGPTRMSRIETDKTILPHLPVSTEERAGNLIEACVARGTAHLRTHVDIDLESRLLKLDGVLAARERHRGRVSVQIVAFPQSGVVRCPGVLLDAAVREGADLVGGIDPLEIDRDPKGQLDGIFAIAARHGCRARHPPARAGRDGPLQCPGDLCPHPRIGLGRQGHDQPRLLPRRHHRKEGRGRSRSDGQSWRRPRHPWRRQSHSPPLEMLRAAGVLVFAGNDDIRDSWSPYGTGDLLERAAIMGWKADFRRDDQIETAFDLVSAAGAKALGIADYGVAVGGTATLFTIAASGVPEAVAAHPPRKLVLFEGQIVARDGAVLPAPAPIA